MGYISQVESFKIIYPFVTIKNFHRVNSTMTTKFLILSKFIYFFSNILQMWRMTFRLNFEVSEFMYELTDGKHVMYIGFINM